MKIDAIESEMSNEFVTTSPKSRQPASHLATPKVDFDDEAEPKPAAFQATLPVVGISTGFLLAGETWNGSIEVADPESAQVVDEAAILFANNQNEIVEQMLQDAIAEDNLGPSTLTAWWMLLDFYQLTARKESFESFSIEYASKFETSPPAWNPSFSLDANEAVREQAAVPLVIFSGKMDSGIAKQLDRIQKLSQRHQTLRLEFARVTAVDPVGCGLLLRVLRRLRQAGLDLVLVGATELADKIKAILKVGRRDETEAPWLLLLEILQLLNREAEFEEASIDFCVTFEVSPPPFAPPKAGVTTDQNELASREALTGHFLMPPVVEGKTDDLVSAISAHAALHQPMLIDCSGLARVDFGAAGQLLDGLAPLCANGRQIEFHQVNHLVAALFHVMGMEDIVKVFPRKH